MKNTIVLAAGGTGGHVMPAQALAEGLIEKGHHLFFLTDARVTSLFDNTPWCFKALSLGPLRFFSLKFWADMVKSFFQAVAVLRSLEPQALIAFGGYCTLPSILAAIVLRIPLYLHEQNAVLGKVHRLFLWKAKKLFLGLSPTRGILASLQHKSIVTGTPIRSAFYESLEKESEKREHQVIKENFSILILGGSQGAAFFSDVIPKSLALLPEKVQKKIHLMQQCREELIPSTKVAYQNFIGHVELKPFFKDVAALMSRADLVITRAGASSLAELSVFEKKPIFIPLKTAIYDHQILNAQAYCQMWGGQIMLEETCDPKRLSQCVHDLYSHEKHDSIFDKPMLLKAVDIIIQQLEAQGLTVQASNPSLKDS